MESKVSIDSLHSGLSIFIVPSKGGELRWLSQGHLSCRDMHQLVGTSTCTYMGMYSSHVQCTIASTS